MPKLQIPFIITHLRWQSNGFEKPTVKTVTGKSSLQIIQQGIEDFQTQYGNLIYENGTTAKVVIYCSSVANLENEVYPFLHTTLKIDKSEILRFHNGGNNGKYKLPKNNEIDFKTLDLPTSKKRYILLVQIGKEGWDCQSLTSVILSQTGKSAAKNSIIQSACRCLRQVIKGKHETALIYLNKENHKLLDTQLRKELHTSIEELNNLNRVYQSDLIERFDRTKYLKLPEISFYQLKIKYQAIEEEENANTNEKLQNLLHSIDDYRTTSVKQITTIDKLSEGTIEILNKTGQDLANYNTWMQTIAKESFNTISVAQLYSFDTILKAIFDKITFRNPQTQQLYFNDAFPIHHIQSKIRIAFSIKRYLQTSEETIKKSAQLLIIEKLKPIEPNDYLFPNERVTQQIRDFDDNKITPEAYNTELSAKIAALAMEQKFSEIQALSSQTIDNATLQKTNPFMSCRIILIAVLKFCFRKCFKI
ncbi:MAG: hypothetical protein HC803_07575 [Saprospiraceae bacterium]|nr:hypothetical protein [Saprospiraceae bacterium]